MFGVKSESALVTVVIEHENNHKMFEVKLESVFVKGHVTHDDDDAGNGSIKYIYC